MSTLYLKRLLKPFLILPLRYLQRYQAKWKLIQLKQHHDPSIQAIAKAILNTLYPKFSLATQMSFRMIEKRRQHLIGSQEIISVTDYGAGTAQEKRSQQTMLKGVMVKRSVSQISAASKSAFWARLLYQLLREFKPNNGLELGTCVGISGAYQALALKQNGHGHLQTLEGCPNIAKIASETFAHLGLNNIKVIVGPFFKTFNNTLDDLQTIDYFFNDGHHDYEAVTKNFDLVIPYLKQQALIVIDDIEWSEGMKKAWQEISNKPHVSLALDLGTIGIIYWQMDTKQNLLQAIPLNYQ
jgi:predicted O-methyltransferase YrrM